MVEAGMEVERVDELMIAEAVVEESADGCKLCRFWTTFAAPGFDSLEHNTECQTSCT